MGEKHENPPGETRPEDNCDAGQQSKKYSVTLTFGSAFEKDYFLGQLSDGFGENECTMDWPEDEDLDENVATIHITPIGDNWDHHLRMHAIDLGICGHMRSDGGRWCNFAAEHEGEHNFDGGDDDAP